MILAFGADVIKVEPIDGDTAPLGSSGAGFLLLIINKQAVDLKSRNGLRVANALCENADVVIGNLRPGALDQLGLGMRLFQKNSRLIYCALKGFLDGPYAHRRHWMK